MPPKLYDPQIGKGEKNRWFYVLAWVLIILCIIVALLATNGCAPPPPAAPAAWTDWYQPVVVIDSMNSVYLTDASVFDPLQHSVPVEFLAYQKVNEGFVIEKWVWTDEPSMITPYEGVKAWGIPSQTTWVSESDSCSWSHGAGFDSGSGTGFEQTWGISASRFEDWSAERCEDVYVDTLMVSYLHATKATFLLGQGGLREEYGLGNNFRFEELWYRSDQVELLEQ